MFKQNIGLIRVVELFIIGKMLIFNTFYCQKMEGINEKNKL